MFLEAPPVPIRVGDSRITLVLRRLELGCNPICEAFPWAPYSASCKTHSAQIAQRWLILLESAAEVGQCVRGSLDPHPGGDKPMLDRYAPYESCNLVKIPSSRDRDASFNSPSNTGVNDFTALTATGCHFSIQP
jgi:hypothetical protein